MLIAGPLLFLLFIIGISAFLSIRGVSDAQIPDEVTALAPHILLGVLLGLAIFIITLLPQAKTAWQIPVTSKAVSDVFVGLLCGVILGTVYIFWLAPFLEFLQHEIGDYVPPGAILLTISSNIGVFFIANVLLAPFVEETLYRGIALPLFSDYLGPFWATIFVCTFFGLLHWTGGFWYILLTGVIAGGLFAGLFFWRGGILSPFAAHFAVNVIETIYAWNV